jgi:hypothetical protein
VVSGVTGSDGNQRVRSLVWLPSQESRPTWMLDLGAVEDASQELSTCLM